ncbi:alkene reductase [Bradyrhizobium sp. CCBAU 45389]|uniref:alkene reductase n=1 Tax=Bradyrhizobium sp. CCBAU 45389 TaxID=858429 RepID=UPI00230626ED|nr:alkene reductase [Bradyrhizobium sp. CCBAU 45389]MDA9404397.1 N-ethylmaleimide reductase [Bradyrhizobium sp. CCBAU 45389]
MASLFDRIRLGSIEAANRIFMAPMTRGRATPDHVPTPIMAQYYGQRASAGLILTEAIGISLEGLAWPYAPGIWSEEQIDGWSAVTDAVHHAGGRIVAQLWHMGRLTHSSFPGRGRPVSASATTAPGLAQTYDGKLPYEEAKALDVAEIPALVDQFASAARNAVRAGFDGVQIHAANGYLLDQFLRSSSNLRRDGYGGSAENRIRLLQEVTAAVIQSIGADRTAVRLSPNGEIKGVNDDDPEGLFVVAAKMLSTLGIAFLEVREPDFNGTNGKADRLPVAPLMRRAFNGPLVLNSDYDAEKGQAALDAGQADAIAFGRLFIANPDLPDRLARGLPPSSSDPATWYSRGAEGYTEF